MNAAISRGQMLAQDEDTNMEDVQSAPTPSVNAIAWTGSLTRRKNRASQSGGVICGDDENDKMRFECPLSLDIGKTSNARRWLFI